MTEEIKDVPPLTKEEKIQKIEDALKELSLEANFKPSLIRRTAMLEVYPDGSTYYPPIFIEARLKQVNPEAKSEDLQAKYSSKLDDYGWVFLLRICEAGIGRTLHKIPGLHTVIR